MVLRRKPDKVFQKWRKNKETLKSVLKKSIAEASLRGIVNAEPANRANKKGSGDALTSFFIRLSNLINPS